MSLWLAELAQAEYVATGDTFHERLARWNRRVAFLGLSIADSADLHARAMTDFSG